MAQALITPNVLSWARQRAHISIDMLANKLQKKVEDLEAWERGERRPTFKQAQTLAKKLHIPFGYLFLSEPPIEKLPIPDLRTLEDSGVEQVSIAFKDILSDIKRKQSWYRDYIIESGEDKFAYLGKFSIDDGVEKVATSIRVALGCTASDREKCYKPSDYLKFLTTKIEDIGVLVMRNSVVGSNTSRSLNVEEFRGFAIADDYAPLIFINSSDANNAKTFTLIHELAHLWINKSGISSVDLSHEDENKIELFCNAVSAEVLVPVNEFKSKWDDTQEITKNAVETAAYFKVSSFVTARRAKELSLIDAATFFEYYRQATEEFEKYNKKKKEEQGSGGNPYATTWSRNGKRFSRAVVASALSQDLLLRDAGRLLNMNPNNVIKFAKKLEDK
jgi:Zn-dependent peptidase ImmA (M78 family)/transcriptional regulator with XRE-family HTH domain